LPGASLIIEPCIWRKTEANRGLAAHRPARDNPYYRTLTRPALSGSECDTALRGVHSSGRWHTEIPSQEHVRNFH